MKVYTPVNQSGYKWPLYRWFTMIYWHKMVIFHRFLSVLNRGRSTWLIGDSEVTPMSPTSFWNDSGRKTFEDQQRFPGETGNQWGSGALSYFGGDELDVYRRYMRILICSFIIHLCISVFIYGLSEQIEWFFNQWVRILSTSRWSYVCTTCIENHIHSLMV